MTGAMLLARSPVFVFLAQSDMENCQAFKEELQSDRNRVFRLVTGGTGAVIARKIEKEESGARLKMR